MPLLPKEIGRRVLFQLLSPSSVQDGAPETGMNLINYQQDMVKINLLVSYQQRIEGRKKSV